ncbi:MAG: hypothetical protein WBE92_09800 [Steroidobacteraceae bacterium]
MGYLTRRSSAWRAHAAALSFLVTAAAACGVAGATGAGNAQPAQWVQKTIRFTYLGFTTHYSCEGLRDEVRLVLLELGARKRDLSVHPYGCTRLLGGAEHFPGVAGTFSVLQPQTGTSGGPTVAAHWQTVQVRLNQSSFDEAGQCELLEQVEQTILPLFVTRNVRFQSDCIPYQLTIPGAALQVDVLKPDRGGASKVAQED